MNNINDLQQYKRAKTIVKELDFGLKLIILAIRGFEKIKKYTAIQSLLLELKDAKEIVEIQLEQHKEIVKSKGEIK